MWSLKTSDSNQTCRTLGISNQINCKAINLALHIMGSKHIRTEVTWVNPKKSGTIRGKLFVHRRLQREHIHSIFFWMSRTICVSSSRPLSRRQYSTHRKLCPVWSRTVNFHMLSKDTSAESSMKQNSFLLHETKKVDQSDVAEKIDQCKKWKDRSLQSELLD